MRKFMKTAEDERFFFCFSFPKPEFNKIDRSLEEESREMEFTLRFRKRGRRKKRSGCRGKAVTTEEEGYNLSFKQ